MENEIDYGAVFGVTEELAAAEGAKEQEPANPAPQAEEAQGAEEQDPAAPAADHDTDPGDQPQDEGDGSEEEEGQGKPAQTPEERARYAAARRKAEQERDAAIERARQEAERNAQQQLDASIAALGLINPYTKQPITTKAEFDAFKTRRLEEQKSKVLTKSGMSQEEFNQFLQDLPEVRQAKEAKQQADAMLQRVRQDNAKARMDAQLQAINKLDPSISTVEDLAKSEHYDEMLKMVKNGYSIVDAFKLTNFEKLQQQTVTAAKQAAMNAAKGKGHLQQTGARGAGAVSVPESVKAEYRSMMPDATDEEIQKHWAAYQKSLKK